MESWIIESRNIVAAGAFAGVKRGAMKNWMSWEGGVDLTAMSKAGLSAPNIIVHIARMVHTPAGSAPSGMILWHPDPKAAPVLCCYVCTDEKLGGYFGHSIFAGTPFEKAPAMKAKIEVTLRLPEWVSARVEVAGHVFETKLSHLGGTEAIQRAAGQPMPFLQQGLEAKAEKATLKVDGKEIAIQMPPTGVGGGPAAVWAPTGIYSR